MVKKLTLALAVTMSVAHSASAQVAPAAMKSDMRGFMIGVRVAGSEFTAEESDAESGSGGGVVIGVGLTQTWMLFAAVDYAKMESKDAFVQGDYGLAHVDLGVRANFRSAAARLRPYALAALTGRAAAGDIDLYDDEGFYIETGDYSFSGAGVTAGGGLAIFFSPSVALDIGLNWSFGSFDSFEFAGETFDTGSIDANSARFTFGLSWLP